MPPIVKTTIAPITRRLFATGLCVAATLSLSPVSAQETSFEALFEAAKNERELQVAISSPARPETRQKLIAAFNERFGLDARIQWAGGNVVQSNTRILAEKSRNTVSLDVIGTGGITEAMTLAEVDMLKPYPWREVFEKELPGIGDAAESSIPELRNMILPEFDAMGGIAYNPREISAEELPDKVTDLADPKFRGKIAGNAFGLSPLDFMSNGLGVDETKALMEAFVANEPILERGTAAATRAVVVGQVPMAIGLYHIAERVSTPENPIAFKFLDDFISVSHLYFYVPEKAPNPNLARLFAAWLATEGMAIAKTMEPMPSASDPKVAEQLKASVDRGAQISTERSMAEAEQSLAMRKFAADLLANVSK